MEPTWCSRRVCSPERGVQGEGKGGGRGGQLRQMAAVKDAPSSLESCTTSDIFFSPVAASYVGAGCLCFAGDEAEKGVGFDLRLLVGTTPMPLASAA